jgi:hypothetical protein
MVRRFNLVPAPLLFCSGAGQFIQLARPKLQGFSKILSPYPVNKTTLTISKRLQITFFWRRALDPL